MRMTTPTRLTALVLGAALAAFAGSGCQAAPGQEHNHWNLESAGSRAAYHFLGYREDQTATYREHQWQQKQDINLTLRRHFLNSNPYNPFQAADPNVVAPRPAHSLLPDPVGYFHLESLAMGSGLLALSGAFIPVPVGSLIGTFEDGGWDEFEEGISNTFSGSFRRTLDDPPSVDEFEVKNR